jgi:hypothetical protein
MLMWFRDASGSTPLLLPPVTIAAVVFTILTDNFRIVAGGGRIQAQIDRPSKEGKENSSWDSCSALSAIHF